MAGAGMKTLKTRIASINNTKQITNAMHLVASSKLRKAKQMAEDSSEYFETLYKTIVEIAMSTKGVNSEFLKEKELKKRCHIVVAGDRGLAGGYNSNVFKEAAKYIGASEDCAIPIGKKAYDYFAKRGIEIVDSIDDVEKHDYDDIKRISEKVMDLFLKGEISEVLFTYTKFESALSQEPKTIKLLPLVFDKPLEQGAGRKSQLAEESDPNVWISEEILNEREQQRKEEDEKSQEYVNSIKNKKTKTRIKYLPDAMSVLEFLIPTYVAGIINGGVVESYASEQGARRTAMESATDNANEMIHNLELSYNRVRQGAITQEITEISAGVEALK